MLRALALTSLLLTPNMAMADISVRFVEGAPKDTFLFELSGACGLGPATLTLDLSGSDAGLVFDVTASGAGVEVFQPFELVSGGNRVEGQPLVRDGDNALSLNLSAWEPGETIAFTIDVDDTIGEREITVSRAEITGAEARVRIGGVTYAAPFGPDAAAVIPYAPCLS